MSQDTLPRLTLEPKLTRRADDHLPLGLLVSFGAPSLGKGFMFLLISTYLVKYATDVLLLAPAAIGALFGLSRLWDAISDPLVGFATDRTRHPMGRRRPWILLGAIPMGISFILLWSPPSGLEGTALTLFMGAALLAFYTSMTMVDVPHSALGAELTDAHHERTRIFGVQRIVFGVGTLGAVAGIASFGLASDPRLAGRMIAIAAAVVGVLGCLVCVLRLREREEFRDRGPRHPYEAFVGVWQNPHARILLSVFLIQQLGIATLTTCMPFYAQYVLEAPERTFVYIGAMLGASILGVPLWMRFAPRFEKKTGLVFAMASIGVAISLLGFTQPGDDFPVIVIAIVGGLLAAGTDVLFPSLQADVIDYDELRSGKRREGAYFSAWAFAAKSASAVSAMVVGFALQSMDFVPNAEQTESVRLGLRFITGFVPALLWGLGIVIFLRFSLDEREHRRILQGLGRA